METAVGQLDHFCGGKTWGVKKWTYFKTRSFIIVTQQEQQHLGELIFTDP